MKSQKRIDVRLMTDREIAAVRNDGAVAILPVGALEQHGPHLPVDTDAVSAHAMSLGAAQLVAPVNVLVFPPVVYGFSPHHLSRPSTISLGLNVFLSQLRDIVRCLTGSGFERIAIVNGHGGNSAPLRALVTEIVCGGVNLTSIDYWEPSRAVWAGLLKGELKTVGHACEFETALQLVLRDPELADAILAKAKPLAPRLTQPFVAQSAEDGFTRYGAVAPPVFSAQDCGYYGDPAAATRETGQELSECVTDGLASFLRFFASVDLVTGAGGTPDR